MSEIVTYPLLGTITSPRDLKALDEKQCVTLAQEIRKFLVEKVSTHGGHLGPNLGVVELTLAIHRVFDSPHDPIIFDTGHQSYVHKIVTGRSKEFDHLRQEGGLSGYPSRHESPHDWVESSHASSSLSYADGFSRAFQYTQDPHTVVVVIGDGALTGGMAWEALNNIASRKDAKIVIIVNDNGRSYAETIGGLAQHLTFLQSTPKYEKILNTFKSRVKSLPYIGSALYSLSHGFKVGIKDIIKPQQMFSDLKIKYLGPVDGHNISALEEVLANAQRLECPVIVHAVTQKGRGYLPAEKHAEDLMHSTGKIDPTTGQPLVDSSARKSWTRVFSDTLIAIGQENPRIVALTAAMPGPTGLLAFGQLFPERMIDVGIAEQHALTSAAGMAMAGMHPVVAVYSTFLNRAFDQLLMDVALHSLPVTIVLDRAGITGSDGPSHNGMWDLSLTSIVPGLKVAAPRDERTLVSELGQACNYEQGPTLVRFPKGSVIEDIPAISTTEDGLQVIYSSGSSSTRVLIISIGSMAGECIAAAQILAKQDIEIQVVDPCWIYPVAPSVVELAQNADITVTVEDNGVRSGYGAVFNAVMHQHTQHTCMRNIGLPQDFIEQASRDSILERYGLEAEHIARNIMHWVEEL